MKNNVKRIQFLKQMISNHDNFKAEMIFEVLFFLHLIICNAHFHLSVTQLQDEEEDCR